MAYFGEEYPPNYYAELGGEGSRARVDSLIGNLQTKIFHANSDPETNTYAAEVIGKSWQTRRGNSFNMGRENVNFGKSQNESFDYDCPPQEFTRLLKGGPDNKNIVEGIVFQNGRAWEKDGGTGQDAPIFLRGYFKQ